MLKKAMIVASKEYSEVVQKKSFVALTLITPAFLAVMMFLPMLLLEKSESPSQVYVVVDLDNNGFGQVIFDALGTVETQSGKPQFALTDIETFPSPESETWLLRRKNLDSLVQSGELDGVMIIHPNVLFNDSIVVISRSVDFTALEAAEDAISATLISMRLERSEIAIESDSLMALTSQVDISVESPTGKRRNFGVLYMMTVAIWMLMFMTTNLYGQGVMRSVIEEKNSRIMEVMVSSVSPTELMMGKLIGLGAATLTQLSLWLVLGYGVRMFMSGGVIADGAAAFTINTVLLVFFGVYFILGFLLYSNMYAVIGCIVSNEKEAQNYMMPVTMSMMIPFMVGLAGIKDADGLWITVLSFVPFVTPILMVIRINIIDPSGFNLAEPIILQALLGVIIVALTLALMVWLSGRIFRVGLLMTGKRATFPEIVRWIRQK